MKKIAVVGLMLVVGACAGSPGGSLTGVVKGSDKLRTPEYAVRGATRYDQVWINTTTEALVDGFGQPRPKPRPSSFDKPARKAKPKPVVTQVKVAPATVPKAKTKKVWPWLKKKAT